MDPLLPSQLALNWRPPPPPKSAKKRSTPIPDIERERCAVMHAKSAVSCKIKSVISDDALSDSDRSGNSNLMLLTVNQMAQQLKKASVLTKSETTTYAHI
jgi:hypothetical protein